MQVFLSFSFAYQKEADALAAALRELPTVDDVFLSSDTLLGGQKWLEELQEQIHAADAFVFLLGEHVGNWQRVEFADAFDRKVGEDATRKKSHKPPLPLVPLVFKGDAPASLLRRDESGLPFVQRLHLIVDPDAFVTAGGTLTANPSTIEDVSSALQTVDVPSEPKLWKALNPYHGLKALREQDADFLFGRNDDIDRFISAIAQEQDQLLLALGASGVGKSSLIFGGVFAAMERHALPDGGKWPQELNDSRLWPRLSLTPGTNPVQSLVGAFIRQWIDPTTAVFRAETKDWRDLLVNGDNLAGLVDAADTAYSKKHGDPPPRYLIYVDQGEELYTRAGRDPARDGTSKETESQKEARRFSELLAEAVGDERIVVLMSARADFLDRLQADQPLHKVRKQLDIAPLAEAELLEVVTKPAELLGASFENGLDTALVASAREHIGGLPLLSDTLTTLWGEMQASDQGVLRWSEPPSQGVSVALKLAERAEAFVQAHPDQRNVIRKLFCVHLAHVPNQGDPTRKSIWLDDLTADEQALITELSGPDQRILTTGDRDGRAYAEVAHEALFNAWKELRKWISERHGFYAWATEVESDRADYEKEGRRRSALLTGRPLERAKAFMEADADDIPELDGHFIRASIKRQRIFKALIACGVGLVFVVLVAATAVYSDLYADSELLRAEAEAQTLVAKAQTAVAETERARAEQTQNEALLSQSKFLAYISINETDSGDASNALLRTCPATWCRVRVQRLSITPVSARPQRDVAKT